MSDDKIDALVSKLDRVIGDVDDGDVHFFNKADVDVLKKVIQWVRFAENFGVFSKWVVGIFIAIGSAVIMYDKLFNKGGGG